MVQDFGIWTFGFAGVRPAGELEGLGLADY